MHKRLMGGVDFHLRERFRDPSSPAPPSAVLHYEAWLEYDGIPVVYMTLIHAERPKGPAYIQTIETRPGYRRQGWATWLIKEVPVHLKHSIVSMGIYTPDGFAALYGKVRIMDGVAHPTEPTVGPQTFVQDWDGRYGPVIGNR
jgi:GNAT superfamily N-acetyltransferase